MTMDDVTPLFDDFWEASSLDRFNVTAFGSRLTSYDADGKELVLEYPQAATPLPSPRTRLGRIARKRRSDRKFSGTGLTDRELGALLASVRAWRGLEHRGYASAGATYVTEVFCVGFRGAIEGQIAYYDPEAHGLVTLPRTAPTWEEAHAMLNTTIEGVPSVLVALVVFPTRATGKYGERGGRFALLEAGAAMQQLSLAVADSRRVKGVIVGGMLDAAWLGILGLDKSQLDSADARVAVGYLLGR